MVQHIPIENVVNTKSAQATRSRRPVPVFVICAHRNNLETRTIGVTAPVVNHRSIRSRRAPRRHPSLTKCEPAEGSSAAPATSGGRYLRG